MPDVQTIVNVMVATQQTALEPDDPQLSFLLQAWARICKALGKDFAPYLDLVMPPLLAAASYDPDLTISGNGIVNPGSGRVSYTLFIYLLSLFHC